MTTYVKFTVHAAPQSPVFAAIWLKSSKRLIVGLALPEEYEAEELGPAPPGTMYKGLDKYFVVERGGAMPRALQNGRGWPIRMPCQRNLWWASNSPQGTRPWVATTGWMTQSSNSHMSLFPSPISVPFSQATNARKPSSSFPKRLRSSRSAMPCDGHSESEWHQKPTGQPHCKGTRGPACRGQERRADAVAGQAARHG